MSLFPCPDCGRLVSTRARACRHCGYMVELASLVLDQAPMTLDQIGERTWRTTPEDLLDRPLLLELHGMRRRLRLVSAEGGNGSPNTLLPGKHYSASWADPTLFLEARQLRGTFKLRSGPGKVYLLTPLGHIEFVFYHV